MKLLVRLGTPEDLTRVAALLVSPEDPLRIAAAAALAETPEGSALLIETASADPRLFAPAARSINAHDLSADGLRRLASLPAIDPATRDAAIVDLAGRLPDDTLAVAVAGAALPPALAETLLARLADPERERTPGVLDGIILLADTRVDLGRPAEAIALLASIDPAMLGESQLRVWAGVRLAAVITGGDLAGVASISNTTLTDWMNAWRRLPPASERRPTVARTILDRFQSEVNEDQRAELAAATRAANPAPANAPRTPSADPSDDPTDKPEPATEPVSDAP